MMSRNTYIIIFFLCISLILIGCEKKESFIEEGVVSSGLLLENSMWFDFFEIEENAAYYSVKVLVQEEEYGSVDILIENMDQYGSVVTLQAIPQESTFLFWVEQGHVVSYETRYHFLLTSNHRLVAHFLPKEGYASVYLDSNGYLIDLQIHEQETPVATDKTPFEKVGVEFTGYRQINHDQSNVYIFQALYDKKDAKYTVTTENGFIVGEDEHVTIEASYGKEIEIVCNDPDFLYWMMDDQIISYQSVERLIVVQDVWIRAIVGSIEPRRMQLYMFGSHQDENYAVVVFGFANPNELEIVEMGVVVTKGWENQGRLVSGWTRLWKQSFPYSFDGSLRVVYFDRLEDEPIYLCLYIVTNNGTQEHPVYITHYSEIYRIDDE